MQLPRGFHLVTTHLPEARSTTEIPNLLLGPWCIIGSEDGPDRDSVAPPYGLSAAERDENTDLAVELENSLIAALAVGLDSYHAATMSERQWGIMLRPWLRQLIRTTIHRHGALSQCVKQFPLLSMTQFPALPASLVPHSTLQAAWLVTDPFWSSWLDSVIIDELRHEGFLPGFELQFSEPLYAPNSRYLPRAEPGIGSARSHMRRGARWLAKVGQRSRDSVFLSTYMPPRAVVGVQLRLRQIPTIPELLELDRRLPIIETGTFDQEGRQQIAEHIPIDGLTGLARVLACVAPLQIPTAFVESFSQVQDSVGNWQLPARPRRVVTANAFTYDDHFKVWLAKKIGQGSVYFAVQHGNNYGTHRWYNPSVEETTSDHFITWGWGAGRDNYLPGYIVKPLPSRRRGRRRKHLLLSEYPPPFRRTVWDEYSEFVSYFEEQLAFVASLDDSVRANLLLRLHHESAIFDFNEVARWENAFPGIRSDVWQTPIGELWDSSRLVVHSYDSTGILECLASNTPTVAFWQNGLAHVTDDARPFYQDLVASGIVHLSPESAAAQVNLVWEDVDSWWSTAEVQSSRLQFAERYARTSPNLARDFTRLIR